MVTDQNIYRIDWASRLPSLCMALLHMCSTNIFRSYNNDICVEFWRKKIRCLNGSTFIKAEDLIILAQMVITEHSAANSFALSPSWQWTPCLPMLKLNGYGARIHGRSSKKQSNCFSPTLVFHKDSIDSHHVIAPCCDKMPGSFVPARVPVCGF